MACKNFINDLPGKTLHNLQLALNSENEPDETSDLIIKIQNDKLILVNSEDELIYACGIREIKEITKSRSNSDFKTDLLHSRNVGQLLRNCGFDFSRLWNRTVAFEWESLRKGKPDRKAVSEKKR